MQKDIKPRVPSPLKLDALTKEEQEAVSALDSIQFFEKGTILRREGETPKESFFVVKGIVRKFKLEDGIDTTVEFYAEQQDVFSFANATHNPPSKFSLECLEDCEISVVSFELGQEMYKRFPRFERMCRLATEQNLMKYQEHFSNFISWSPQQRYQDILENRPYLIERVPQYHLASYLGVKPESLSRIRKRIAGS